MRQEKRTFVAALLSAALIPFAALLAGGNPGKGKQLYDQNCASCHQKEGRGQAGFAPSIGNRDFLATASDEFIIQTVMKGRAGTSMVPRPDLKGEKIQDIIAYLRSLPVKVPIKVSVDPKAKYSGDASHGAELYKNFCAGCHGKEGEGYASGGAGPAIGKPGFLNVASDDFILQTVKRGRAGTAMRPFSGRRGLGHLTDQDIKDIIAWLRSKK